jgi:trk system potassium uptake protein TrkA
MDEAFGSVSVIGDCVDWAVLSRAGANRADAVIATSNDDGVNLIACQIAKHRFEVTTTISVVNHSDHVDLFNALGVDVTVDAPDLMLNQIQEGLTSQQITHLKPLPANGQDRSLVSIRIPREYGSESRRLGTLSFPQGTLLTLVITRDGEPHLPTDDLEIRAGDEIVAVTTAHGEDELRDLLSNDLVI